MSSVKRNCIHLALMIILPLLALTPCNGEDGSLRTVPLDSPGIKVKGTLFAGLRPDGLHFDRFDATILDSTTAAAKVDPVRARTTSGVIITLASRAPLLRLTFVYDPAHLNRGSEFGIYRNGQWVREVVVGKEEKEAVIELVHGGDPQQTVLHEVVLPSWSNPILQRVELTEGFALDEVPGPALPEIVFLGDSISHGTGQGSASFRNYPFIASRKLGMDAYNLAVGGGKISPPVAGLLQHFDKVEVIWILVGYNNWQGASHEIATIREDYEELLATVRRHQPEAEVFCCTLTFNRNEVDAESGVPVEAVREAVADIVTSRINAGDGRLHLIRAENLSSDDDLPRTRDRVHFSEEGAARFAEEVYRIVLPFSK